MQPHPLFPALGLTSTALVPIRQLFFLPRLREIACLPFAFQSIEFYSIGAYPSPSTNDTTTSQCDEGRPECRNCQKSKRQCLGYDPVFQSQGPHSIQPASSASTTTATAVPSTSGTQPRRYTVTPNSPSTTSHSTSLNTTSPRDTLDFSYSKPPDILPHLNQPYKVDHPNQSGLSAYPSSARRESNHQQPFSTSGLTWSPSHYRDYD